MNSIIDSLPRNENGEVIITENVLENFWDQIFESENTASNHAGKLQFINDFKSNFEKDESGNFHFKTPGWKISLSEGIIKSALAAPTLYGVLWYFGVTTGLAAVVVPTILPFFFDIKRIELSKKEEEIFAELPLLENSKKYKTSREWYHSLPNKIKKDVNELDFLDFMQKLVDGGLALENKKGKFEVFGKGRKKLKISFT